MHQHRSTSVRNSITTSALSQASEPVSSSAGNLRSSGKVLSESAIAGGSSSSLGAQHFLHRNQISSGGSHNDNNNESTPPPAAAAAAAAARSQLDNDNNNNEEEEALQPRHCCSSSQQQQQKLLFHQSGLTDPTETDLTETTTRAEEEFASIVLAQPQHPTQEAAQPAPTTVVESAAAAAAAAASNNDNNKNIAARPFVSLSDLIQRLQSVTRQGGEQEEDAKDGSAVVLGGQASAATEQDTHHQQHNIMSVEELAQLLSQLNESQLQQQLPMSEGVTVPATTDRREQKIERGKREPATSPVVRATSPDDHAPLLPLSELIDRLHQVSASEQERAEAARREASLSSSSKMHQVLHRNSLTTAASLERQRQWSVAELTRLLHHINHVQVPLTNSAACAEKQTAAPPFPRSKDPPATAPSPFRTTSSSSMKDEKDDDDARTVPLVVPARRGFASTKQHLSNNTFAVHSLGSLPQDGRNFSWNTDDDEDDDEVFPDTSHSCFVHSAEPSLSPEDLFDRPDVVQRDGGGNDDDDDNASTTFSLVVASSESVCESSVTWFEGSDIDEITVDADHSTTNDDDDDDDAAALLEETFSFEHHPNEEEEHEEQQQPVRSNAGAADA